MTGSDERLWQSNRMLRSGRDIGQYEIEIVVTYKGKVENDLLKGTMQMGERGSFAWSAVRVK